MYWSSIWFSIDSEAATEITLAGLKQPFCFCSVAEGFCKKVPDTSTSLFVMFMHSRDYSILASTLSHGTTHTRGAGEGSSNLPRPTGPEMFSREPQEHLSLPGLAECCPSPGAERDGHQRHRV